MPIFGNMRNGSVYRYRPCTAGAKGLLDSDMDFDLYTEWSNQYGESKNAETITELKKVLGKRSCTRYVTMFVVAQQIL